MLSLESSAFADGEFKDKVALVTGAGQGLGRELAMRLSLLGAHVIAVSTTTSHLMTLDDALQAQNRKLTLAPIDLAKLEKIDELVGGIYQRFGRLDILLSAAAMLGSLSPIALGDVHSFSQVLQVNLHANVTLLQLCHPLLMRSSHPRGVFLSCKVGKNTPHWGFYHASKVALEAIVTAYALETPKSHARVNVLRPPLMHTKIYKQAYPGRAKMQKNSQDNASFKAVPPPTEHTILHVLRALSLHEDRHGSIIDISD